MSFDEQPDAPLHGECAAEIKRLGERVKSLKEALEELVRIDEESGLYVDGAHGGELVMALHDANKALMDL